MLGKPSHGTRRVSNSTGFGVIRCLFLRCGGKYIFLKTFSSSRPGSPLVLVQSTLHRRDVGAGCLALGCLVVLLRTLPPMAYACSDRGSVDLEDVVGDLVNFTAFTLFPTRLVRSAHLLRTRTPPSRRVQ